MFKKIIGITPEPQIHAYYGFGSSAGVRVIGRVTESVRDSEVKLKYSAWDNLLVFIQSYLANSISDQEIEVTFAGETIRTQTDKLGFYDVVLVPKTLVIPQKSGWMEGSVRIFRHNDAIPFAVLVQGQSVPFGIISDIDDTVLISNATNKFRLIYSTIFKHASARKAFPGVTELYRSFRKGCSGEEQNPFFYVSSSHWNLFTFLTTFFQLNTLPQGPLLLKQTAGLRSTIKSVGKHHHKAKGIISILESFPDTPFILIGDSGQQDAEIYSAIYEKYPQRIKEIYIRDLTKPNNKATLKPLKQVVVKRKLVVFKTSEEITMHARKSGHIQ